MEFIGQKNTLQLINSFTLNTVPKTLMFIGEPGCGKHSMCLHLANNLGLPLHEIDVSTITPDDLISFARSPLRAMYLIDLDKASSSKITSKLLKFIEEPYDSVYVVLIASSETQILPTIANRCKTVVFEPYTKEQLKQFTWLISANAPDLVFEICKTPGQLRGVDALAIEKLQSYCDLFIDNLSTYTLAATLAFSKIINLKENYDKFELDLTLNMLEHEAFNKYITDNNTVAYIVYSVINRFKQARKLMSSAPIKENFVLDMLTTMWKETR